MGLTKRLSVILKTKASKVLDRAEDPRETLDYAYQKQLESLQQMRRATADMATARKRVELQATKLQQNAEKLQSQAQQALSAGNESLAREALARRAEIGTQLDQLKAQYDQLTTDQDKLVSAQRRVEGKVETFRMQKEMVKANYSAAQAQAQIGEAVSGISEEMGDVGSAMQRAKDRTEDMQARSGALDELLASGVLDDATGASDPIQAQLDRLSQTSGVDAELERMKAQLGGRVQGQVTAGAPEIDARAPLASSTPVQDAVEEPSVAALARDPFGRPLKNTDEDEDSQKGGAP